MTSTQARELVGAGASILIISAKGCLYLPRPLREALGEPVGCMRGPGRSLMLFPADQAPQLACLLPRELTTDTFVLPVNSAGRITIPQQHRQYAGLWAGAEVAVVLQGSCAVVMRGEAWETRVAAAVALFWGEWMRKAVGR